MSEKFMINPDSFTYMDAPLKMLNESQLREINSELVKNKFCTGVTIVPHFFNKMTFIYIPNTIYSCGILGKLGDFTSNFFQSHLTPLGLGNLLSYTSDRIVPNSPLDFVWYYELGLIKDLYWQNIGTNPPLYDNVCLCMTGYGGSKLGGAGDITDVSPNDKMLQLTCIKSPNQTDKPSPTHNYDNWYYVKSLRVYKRDIGSSVNRDLRADGVCPCVVWDVTDYSDFVNKKSKIINGNFNGFITADYRLWRDVPIPSLWQLGEWLGANVYRIKDPIVGTKFTRHTNNEFWHKTNLPENIKFLIAEHPNNEQSQFLRLNDGTSLWCINGDNDDVIDNKNVATLAFKNEQDFLDLMRDWGITRITNDKTTAETLPSDLFPDDGFVPSGGNTTGFDNDPVITNIPSFADNTSDIIDIVTPNITSISAASAYALSLSGVKELFNWLMTKSFLDNISNLFSDKLSAINDLKIMPFDLVDHDMTHTEYSDTLTLANVSENISCYKILAGYNYIVDGGSYKYTAYWGNYNDFTSATYYLYVPYAGITDMSPSHIVNCNVNIKYAVDIMTGNAMAIIYSDDVFVKMIPCQIGQTVPITFTNTNQRDIKNAISALNIVGNVAGIASSAAVGDVGGAVMSGLGVVGDIAQTAMTNPLKYESKGNFSSGTALLMPQSPFLIVTRAQLSIPSNINHITGKPSNIYSTINNFVGSGFVSVNVLHIATTATTAEQSEILNLLHAGIFI